MNGAEVIAEILKREGTEFLSCYPRNQVIDVSFNLGSAASARIVLTSPTGRSI